MITLSDNMATDILLSRVGAERVTETMRELGIDSIRVDRSTRELIRDWLQNPNEKFLEDKRDIASPRGMAGLLEKIHDGEAASKESTRQMIQILEQQQFRSRIPHLLPPVSVAHKTGTIGFTVIDAGIIFTEKKEPIALAIFTLKDDLKLPVGLSEDLIARLSLAVYDYFVYDPIPSQ
jgi:beta-lactamase class A